MASQDEDSVGGPQAPQSWGKYEIGAEIGSGELAVVHQVQDPVLGHRAVLKRAAEFDLLSQGALKDEGFNIVRSKHANVVQLYDFVLDEPSGRLEIGLILEPLDGGTLNDWLEAEERDWRAIVRKFCAVGRGLAAVHAAGLVHRDFKPENVVLDDHGIPKLLDFGLAAEADNGEDAFHPQLKPLLEVELVGTPEYLAPECFFRFRRTPSSDQFSFCASLWEALYGTRPFRADSISSLRTSLIRGIPLPPPRGKAPKAVHRALERGLRVDPCSRFPDMQQLLLELDPKPRPPWQGAVFALVVLFALVVGGFSCEHQQSLSICEGRSQEFNGIWNPTTRASLVNALKAGDSQFATSNANMAASASELFATTWAKSAGEVCRSYRLRRFGASEIRWNRTLHAAGRHCLENARLEFEATVDVFSTPGLDGKASRGSEDAFASLSDPSRCSDVARMAKTPRLPARVGERERLGELTGQLADLTARFDATEREQLLTETNALRRETEELGWHPLDLRARLLLGRIEHALGQPSFEQLVSDVHFDSIAQDAPDVTVDSALFLFRAVGVDGARASDANRWYKAADASLARIGASSSDLRRLDLEFARGVQLARRGDAAEAVPVFQELLRQVERLYPSGHHRTLRALYGLGRAHQEAGHLEEALNYGKRAVELRESFGENDLIGQVKAMATLASTYDRLGRLHDALDMRNTALTLLQSLNSSDKRQLSDILLGLGQTYRKLARFEEAIQFTNEALDLRVELYGRNHPAVAGAIYSLAAIYGLQRSSAQAVSLFDEAASIWSETLGLEHPVVGTANASSCQVYVMWHRDSQAMEHCNRAEQIFLAAEDSRPSELANVRLSKAVLLRRAGELGSARASVLLALTAWRRAVGDQHAYVARGLTELGEIEMAAGASALAIVRCTEARTTLESSESNDREYLSRALSCLGRAQLAAGKLRHAGDSLEKAIKTFDPEIHVEHLARARFALAQTLVAQHGPREHALNLALAASAGLRQVPGLGETEAREVDDWLKAQQSSD